MIPPSVPPDPTHPPARSALARLGLSSAVALACVATPNGVQAFVEGASPTLVAQAELPGLPEKLLQAGRANGTPPDSPANRVDPNVPDSPFAGVGSLLIQQAGSSPMLCTAVALSPWHVLTAAHCLDLNDDGVADVLPSDITFQVNQFGPASTTIAAAGLSIHPNYTGFNNPVVNDDLAILRLQSPLPGAVPIYPLRSAAAPTIMPLLLVGYGMSGDGAVGYTEPWDPALKRVGGNLLEFVMRDDEGSGLFEVFGYDFEDPLDPAGTSLFAPALSLGNDVETVGGPGDSGSPAFVYENGELVLAGISSFVIPSPAGSGRFGSVGGGIWLSPYLGWIKSTVASTMPVPEGSTWLAGAVLAGGAWWWARRSRRSVPR